MSSPRFSGLEVISRQPPAKVSPRNTPLLFLHGAYAAAWCWDEHFLSFFAERGYACHALSVSGHGASPGRERLDSFGIDHYVRDVAEVAEQLPAAPVLIGHSMGGMVAQKYLEQHEASCSAMSCCCAVSRPLSRAAKNRLQTLGSNSARYPCAFDPDSVRKMTGTVEAIISSVISDLRLTVFKNGGNPSATR